MKQKIIKHNKKFFLLFLALVFSAPVQGKVYINIGAPKEVKKSMMALSSFREEGQPLSSDLSQKMQERLQKNLKFSGYFNILSPQAFIEDPNTRSPVPYPKNSKGFRWQNWKLTKTDFLFFGNYSIQEESQMTLKVYVYNVNLQKTLLQKTYKSSVSQANKLMDKLANDIVEKLSGKKSIFETKILSVRSMGGPTKEMFVMDWNGENKKRITYHRSIVLSPAWSHKGEQVAYSAFVYNKRLKKGVAALFLYDFESNKIKVLSAREGASLGADFYPDRRNFLVTRAGKGLMDIFKVNLKSLKFTPLTKGPWGVINVEPSIHPRTGRIAFSSDRKGKTMIYVMGPNGQNIRQITFAGHHNATPDWHPIKNQIVFSGLSKGRMDLFLISEQGTGLKRLTSLKTSKGLWANCESPSFSPDGRFVIFSSDVSGTYQLYVLNLDDLSIERITFDRYNYKSPKWSPYF